MRALSPRSFCCYDGRQVSLGYLSAGYRDTTVENKRKRYLRDGKAHHRAELMNDSEYDIITRYQGEYRGLAASPLKVRT